MSLPISVVNDIGYTVQIFNVGSDIIWLTKKFENMTMGCYKQSEQVNSGMPPLGSPDYSTSPVLVISPFLVGSLFLCSFCVGSLVPHYHLRLGVSFLLPYLSPGLLDLGLLAL